MSALDGLNAAIANLQSQVSAESTELAGVVNGLTAAQAQLKTLTDQLNSGVQVSTSDLNNLTATITQIADSAAAATAAATAATGGGTPPPPPPAPAP